MLEWLLIISIYGTHYRAPQVEIIEIPVVSKERCEAIYADYEASKPEFHYDTKTSGQCLYVGE